MLLSVHSMSCRLANCSRRMQAFAQTAAMTLAGSAVFYAMTILFGAPLLR